MFVKPLFLLFLTTFATAAFCANSISVGVGARMPDLISYSGGNLSGSLAPLYRCVFDRAGLEAKYIDLPLKRGLRDLEAGKISALLPLAQSAARDRIGLFAGALFVADYVFVSLNAFSALEEKEKLKYVAPRSFIGINFIQDQDAEIHEVNKWSQLVSMLRYDRADVAVLPKLLVSKLFGHDSVDVYQQPAGTLPVSFYLADSERETSLAKRLLKAVDDCSVKKTIQTTLSE